MTTTLFTIYNEQLEVTFQTINTFTNRTIFLRFDFIHHKTQKKKTYIFFSYHQALLIFFDINLLSGSL